MSDRQAKRDFVINVLGVKLGPDTTAPSQDRTAVHKRLTAARGRMDKLPEPERFVGLLRDTILAEKAGEDDKALEVLERLEAALTSAERVSAAALEIAQAREGLGVSVVQFAKLRLKLAALEAAIPMAIENCQDAMFEVLEAEFEESDPSEQVEAFIDRLDEKVPMPPEALRTAIDRMAGTADTAERAKARSAALTAIGQYRTSLSMLDFLELFEKTDHGTYRIADAIVECLDDLETALKG
jgi:hypothetical protein